MNDKVATFAVYNTAFDRNATRSAGHCVPQVCLRFGGLRRRKPLKIPTKMSRKILQIALDTGLHWSTNAAFQGEYTAAPKATRELARNVFSA